MPNRELRTGVNLASFTELAVRLVNSAVCDGEADPLCDRASYLELVADRPFLAGPVTSHDLAGLRSLRADLAVVFTRAVEGAAPAVASQLNSLLTIHPVYPVLVTHDGEPWHLHLSEGGSVIDRYAAACVVSLSLLVSQSGTERFGICAIASCDRVFVSGSKSRRYCGHHSASRGNVTTLPGQPRVLHSASADSVASAAS
jgi:predicted RNA-binding Zn ribbon-like protein